MVIVNIELSKETKAKLDELVGDEKKIPQFINDLIIKKYNLDKGATGFKQILLDFEHTVLTLSNQRKIKSEVYAGLLNAINAAKDNLEKKGYNS